MSTLADLYRAVQTTLASKRLGTPVFVRYLWNGPGATLARLAQTLALVRGWISQDLERLYALGSIKHGHISLTVEFRGGASALIAWSVGAGAGGGHDVTLIGNHGALFHDGGTDRLWDENLDPPALKPDKDLIAWIERALRTGQPEALALGGSP